MSVPLRIAINGFGRMGRLALRAGWDRDDMVFVHVNEIAGGPATGAHLLEFDSVHGRWPRVTGVAAGAIRIDDRAVGWSESRDARRRRLGRARGRRRDGVHGTIPDSRVARAILAHGVRQGRRRGAGQGR